MAYPLRHQEQITTASGMDVLAAMWLFLSPFALRFYATATGAATANNVVLGIVIGILAAIRLISGNPSTVWLSWVNVVLGIWVLISPWCLRFSHSHAATTNNVIMGIAVILLASWSALVTRWDSTWPGSTRD